MVFAIGLEAQVNGTEVGVALGGGKSGHEESLANFTAATGDGTGATESTAIAVERSQAGESGGLIAGKRTQLGHGGQESRSGTDADTLNGSKDLEPGAKYRRIFDELGDEGLQLFDLAIEMAPMTFDGSEELGTGSLLGTVFFPDTVIDQLIATGNEIGKQSGVCLGLGSG